MSRARTRRATVASRRRTATSWPSPTRTASPTRAGSAPSPPPSRITASASPPDPSRRGAPTGSSSATRRCARCEPSAPCATRSCRSPRPPTPRVRGWCSTPSADSTPRVPSAATSTSAGGCSAARGCGWPTRPRQSCGTATARRGAGSSRSTRRTRSRTASSRERWPHYAAYPSLRTAAFLGRELVRSGLRVLVTGPAGRGDPGRRSAARDGALGRRAERVAALALSARRRRTVVRPTRRGARRHRHEGRRGGLRPHRPGCTPPPCAPRRPARALVFCDPDADSARRTAAAFGGGTGVSYAWTTAWRPNAPTWSTSARHPTRTPTSRSARCRRAPQCWSRSRSPSRARRRRSSRSPCGSVPVPSASTTTSSSSPAC